MYVRTSQIRPQIHYNFSLQSARVSRVTDVTCAKMCQLPKKNSESGQNHRPEVSNPLYLYKDSTFGGPNWSKNPLSTDKDLAILEASNPLFSGLTFIGASGALYQYR